MAATGAGFATIYTYPWDLHDEGIDAAFRTIVETAGIRDVSLALSYHYATYFLPHNPVRPIYFGEHGAVYFQPQAERYSRTTLRPQVSSLVRGPEYLSDIVAGARSAGVRLSPWIPYCFNQLLPKTFPHAARRDALGNLYLSHLCPVNADVREYFRALTADVVAQSSADGLMIESLSFLRFDYGFWNPKVLTPISPRCGLLLGLCFCPDCLATGQAGGVDSEALRAEIAAYLRAELPRIPSPGDLAPASEEWIAEAFDGKLAAFLAARAERTTALFEEIVQVAREHGASHVQTVLPTRASQPVSGLIPERVWPLIDRPMVGLPTEPVEPTIRRLRESLPASSQLLVSLHPAQFESEGKLIEVVQRARAAGAAGFTFYNYGLIRQEHLRWIGAASRAWR